ncbi:hypothetical protein ABZW03_02265 [Kitasatospora sp. NPDC004799]|uniref:hypothetical protein n=1 Tax=Kitasatospora sp. NPDC004799 TaxID=3154460 RepID=UPI0033A1D2B2
MSDELTVRSWKDPEAPRTAPGHPLGEPDLSALSGGEEAFTNNDLCSATDQSWCGTCGSLSVGCC